jgi:hypothetical protein
VTIATPPACCQQSVSTAASLGYAQPRVVRTGKCAELR